MRFEKEARKQEAGNKSDSTVPRWWKRKYMFPPGLEPGTFRVLGERDNHYTTETD